MGVRCVQLVAKKVGNMRNIYTLWNLMGNTFIFLGTPRLVTHTLPILNTPYGPK
jgi:hypothetical protein